LCYQKLKNNTDAKKEFSMALEIKPDYIKPRVLRMNMLKTEGEYE
jgi:Tfp pilus assembly protein PilF